MLLVGVWLESGGQEAEWILGLLALREGGLGVWKKRWEGWVDRGRQGPDA